MFSITDCLRMAEIGFLSLEDFRKARAHIIMPDHKMKPPIDIISVQPFISIYKSFRIDLTHVVYNGNVGNLRYFLYQHLRDSFSIEDVDPVKKYIRRSNIYSEKELKEIFQTIEWALNEPYYVSYEVPNANLKEFYADPSRYFKELRAELKNGSKNLIPWLMEMTTNKYISPSERGEFVNLMNEFRPSAN